MAEEKDSLLETISHEFYETYFNLLPCALVLWSGDFAHGMLNPLAKSLIGCAESLSDGSFWLDQVYVDDRERYLIFRRKVAIGGPVVSCDYRILRSGSTKPVWIREVSSGKTCRENLPWEVTSIYFDITDLKDVARSQQRESFQDVIHDLQNRIHVLSMAVELGGLSLKDAIDDRRRSAVFASICRSVQDLRDCLGSLECEGASKNGAEIRQP
jgi:hypothetical protein